MADLDPLIRFRKHGVDEKRRALALLYKEVEKVTRQKEVIVEQMAAEEELAREMGTTEAIAYLGRYLEGARKKVEALDAALAKLDGRIAIAQEDMRAAFADMKKVDIIQRGRNKREAAGRKRKEDAELDEIAIDGFRRNQEE